MITPLRPAWRLAAPAALLLALLSPLAAGVPPARAISEADALRKLAVVPVFVITDGNGRPLPIPRGRTLVLPLFLERSRAEQELANLRRANAGLQARLIPLPMHEAKAQVKAMRAELREGWTLAAPVVPNPADLELARTILRAQGVPEQSLRSELRVPVFFTRPFLTVRAPEGERAVFFLSHDDLRAALARLPQGATAPKPQAADLSTVLQVIVESEADRFLFHPTREHLRLQAEQARRPRAGSAGSAASPAPPAPPAPPPLPPPR